MSYTYNDLKNSDNKLAVLLHRLSYPEKESRDYWERWARQPLHELVLKIIRGLGDYRQRILRLHHEQDYIRRQYEELADAKVVEEDRLKIQSFLHEEYRNLLKMEREILDQQHHFLQQQETLVKERIKNIDNENQKRWKIFYKEQMKFITQEMKKLGLVKEWQTIIKEVEK
ncbi:MAG: hypothetical protein KIT27_07680 [Legionellales bacterium]|nr:hypothetical protein [Legionellales bacterium]